LILIDKRKVTWSVEFPCDKVCRILIDKRYFVLQLQNESLKASIVLNKKLEVLCIFTIFISKLLNKTWKMFV